MLEYPHPAQKVGSLDAFFRSSSKVSIKFLYYVDIFYRLSEAKSRSSSRLLESSNHPGSRSRSHSRLETGMSAPSPNRQKVNASDAAKKALMQNEETEESAHHKQPHKHGSKHHVPVY